MTHKTRLENVKGFEKEIVYVAFDDKEGNEMEKCRAFHSVSRCVQFVFYIFSEPEKDVPEDKEALETTCFISSQNDKGWVSIWIDLNALIFFVFTLRLSDFFAPKAEWKPILF